MGLLDCTVGFNTTPCLRGAGVAFYFFASIEAISLASNISAAMVQALAACKVDFGHSFARCPAALQNMQSPFSNLSGLLAFLPFELDGEFVGWGKLPRDEAFLSDLLDVLLLPLLLLFPGEVLD